MTIGERIRIIRKQKGLTQKELAKMVELSANAMINYETNKRTPSLEAIDRIAVALGVEPTDLIKGHEQSQERQNNTTGVLGGIIRDIRKKQGLTQQELAAKAEISRNALINYEAGTRTPPTDILIKILKALGVTWEDIGDNINLLSEPFKNYIQFYTSIINEVSEWLNNNGFVEASKAVDCHWDL